jgi:SAM-dependent methyltransferase
VPQWPIGKQAQVFACRECGLLFVHPQTLNGSPPKIKGQKQIRSTKRGAARALAAALDQHFPASDPPAGARLLQFGSGTDAWLNAFQSLGWDTWAIAPSGGTPFTQHKRLDAMPTEPSFDFVIAYHVLERLANPLDALRQISAALRPGAYCLISVPRLDTLGIHGQLTHCLHPAKHIVAFTEACLRGLAARAGLEVVAALHDLDEAFTSGEPLRLRLLARKATTTVIRGAPAEALEPVLQAVSVLQTQPQAESAAAPSDCPACGGNHVAIVEEWRLSSNRAHAVACPDCGLLFVHPQPRPEELHAYYAPEGGWKASRLRPAPAQAQPWRNTAVSAVLNALDECFPASHPPPDARVFDFGCGPGNWLDAFSDCGWDTYGLEPSSDAAFARHKRLTSIPSEPQFDLVIAYHVFEHLPRPLDTLRALARTLLPGGFCFISVPRIDTLALHQQLDYCLHPRHHIVAFTEACLRGLFARSGLETVATFHQIDERVSKGLPLRLRMLARKTATPPAPEANAASALKPVIQAFAAMKPVAKRPQS